MKTPRLASITNPIGSSSPSRGYLADAVLLAIGGFAFLVGVIVWLDNAQAGLTANGIFKSMEMQPWISDPATASIYPSNYLFYPLYGALCRILDAFGILAGDARRQMAILNAASASLCVVAVYLLVRSMTQDRLIALAASLFHLACNFVLVLAIINEDIMSGYAVTFASMALAAVWFARPTSLRVVVVGIVFSVGWLLEWRLMFPTLPAMAAALWICEPKPARRIGLIALLLGTVFAMACLAALLSYGHNGAAGPIGILWTGKGVGTAWGGFTWAKVGYLTDGLAGYLLGAGLTTFDKVGGWDIWRYGGMTLMAAIAFVGLSSLWHARSDNRSWALAAVFGGTFVAGEVFNLYSQPHDPQMQLNVMAWLTPAWALTLVAARARWPRRGFASLLAASAVLLAYNLWSLTPLRGMDSAWKDSLERIERIAPPARTLFLVHDYGWMMGYAAYHWDHPRWGTDALGPAPQDKPKFKWIGIAADLVYFPEWSLEKRTSEMRRQIDRALELGYDVVSVEVWNMTLDTLLTTTGMVADRQKIGALHAMLHRDFTATLIGDDPVAGPLYRLQRAPGR